MEELERHRESERGRKTSTKRDREKGLDTDQRGAAGAAGLESGSDRCLWSALQKGERLQGEEVTSGQRSQVQGPDSGSQMSVGLQDHWECIPVQVLGPSPV